MWSPTRRQFMATGGAAASAGLLFNRGARGQTPELRDMAVGVVVPANSGMLAVTTSITDYIGDGARMGAMYAESSIGQAAYGRGWHLRLLHANSPIPEAAERAGQRLVETGNICALVGGIGEGQAEALGAIAEKAQIPFFNIGSSRDALRQENCGRYTFHVEASEAMYVDALAAWFSSRGHRRWFVVYEDTDDGRALHARTLQAISRHGSGGEAVGAVGVQPGQPVYYNEISGARDADPDVILVLANEVDQIAIIGQMRNSRLAVPAVTFPTTISQTRDYIAAARFALPEYNPSHRLALWETTLQSKGADRINSEYVARWGQPTEPTAWGAYSAIKMLFEAADATGTLDGSTLVSYFESPDAVFDVGKGPGVSFRPWDHQLRQPLYMINVDQESEWVRGEVPTWIKLANLAAEVPAPDLAGDTLSRLDLFGDGPGDSRCRL